MQDNSEDILEETMEETPAVQTSGLIENNMKNAILATLFCFLPLGIVAIFYAAKIDSLVQSGNYEEALEAAEKSGFFTKLAFFTGFAIAAVSFLIYLIGMLLSSMAS